MTKITIKNIELDEAKVKLEVILEEQRKLFQELASEMALFCSEFNDTESSSLTSFIEDVSKKNVWLLSEFSQLNTYMNEAISSLNEADETIAQGIEGKLS